MRLVALGVWLALVGACSARTSSTFGTTTGIVIDVPECRHAQVSGTTVTIWDCVGAPQPTPKPTPPPVQPTATPQPTPPPTPHPTAPPPPQPTPPQPPS